jgi:hypothetical protein
MNQDPRRITFMKQKGGKKSRDTISLNNIGSLDSPADSRKSIKNLEYLLEEKAKFEKLLGGTHS